MSKYLDPTLRLLDPQRRDIAPEEGDRVWSGPVPGVKSVDPDRHTVTALVSTSAVDRFGEVIEPEAFRKWMDRFYAAPVFLHQHDHNRPIGSWVDMQITREGLVGTARFNLDVPAARDLWPLYRDGDMRSFSIGALVHKWEMQDRELPSGESRKLRVLTEVELVEVSAVAVGANPEALVRSGAGGGDSGGQPVDKLAELLAARLTPHLTKTIKEQLNAEPGSRLHSIICDAVDRMQWHVAPERQDGVPSPHEGENNTKPGERFFRELRGLLNEE